MRTALIDPATTINDVIAREPGTIAVFNEFGIDACCGGAASLEDAAERDGVELSALLAALEAFIGPAAPTRDAG